MSSAVRPQGDGAGQYLALMLNVPFRACVRFWAAISSVVASNSLGAPGLVKSGNVGRRTLFAEAETVMTMSLQDSGFPVCAARIHNENIEPRVVAM